MSKILAKARAYADACVAECNENFGNSEPADNAMRELVAEIASFEQPQPKQSEPNNDEVICPNCCTQFRAIPVNVQQLMLAAGFEPPFTAPPLREPEQSEPVAWLSESGAWVTTSKAMFEHESAKGKVMTPLYK